MNPKLKSLLPRQIYCYDASSSDCPILEGVLYKGIVFYWCPCCHNAHKVKKVAYFIAPATLMPQPIPCRKTASGLVYVYYHYEVIVNKSKVEIKNIINDFSY